MKVGISTATFFGKALTEDTFELIRRCGVDVCEVFLTTFYEYQPDFCELIKKRKDDACVSVHSVHTLTSQFEPQLFNLAERTRRDAEAIFRQALATMRGLGAKYYTYHGSTVFKASHRAPNFEKLGKRLNELCDIVGEFGGELCMENVHWADYRVPGTFAEVKKFAPSLRACLDIKQAMQSGVHYGEYLREMGEDIRTVHICDYDGDKLMPTGFGTFDFSELKKRLEDVGYDGNILIELYSRDYDSFDTVAEAVYKMKNIFEK